PDAERANVGESQIGTTSAARALAAGASPYGAEELAGNVWEWTRSLWGKDVNKASSEYPYNAQDGREHLADRDMMLRVLRGRTYYYESGGVGCGVRFGRGPFSVYGDLGFRVVLSPSASGR